jgi:hypothetical protein
MQPAKIGFARKAGRKETQKSFGSQEATGEKKIKN